MYLRVSITDRCNLRCVYCLPEDARFASSRASASELDSMATLVAAAVPVRKIRITGGEPTLCDDLVGHVRHARSLVDVVGMTTNGVLLDAQLPALRDAGLNRLNISLDALTAESFRRFSRRDGLDRVVRAIRSARRLGFTPLKINAVAMPGTDYAALVRFAAWEGVHLRFIELMAIGEARPFQAAAYVPADEMRRRIAAAGITLSERQDRDEPTARVWEIHGSDIADSSVGFITTVSAPFCATCDRLRLSSQGRLHTCLMDDHGHDLLTPLRAGDEAAVIATVRAAIARKAPPARFERVGVMASIGG
jgi:cyclic pyranopterin phosphate synthase